MFEQSYFLKKAKTNILSKKPEYGLVLWIITPKT